MLEERQSDRSGQTYSRLALRVEAFAGPCYHRLEQFGIGRHVGTQYVAHGGDTADAGLSHRFVRGIQIGGNVDTRFHVGKLEGVRERRRVLLLVGAEREVYRQCRLCGEG